MNISFLPVVRPLALLCAALSVMQGSPRVAGVPQAAPRLTAAVSAEPGRIRSRKSIESTGAGRSGQQSSGFRARAGAASEEVSGRPRIATRSNAHLVSAAIEAKDDKRIAQYGQKVLISNPTDMQILAKVTASILALNQDKESVAKAFGFCTHTAGAGAEPDAQSGRRPTATALFRWQTVTSRRLADALRMKAQAEGLLGKTEEAVAEAKRGWDLSPTAAGAREWGRWLIASGQTKEAIDRYADAFTLEDPDSTEEDPGQGPGEDGRVVQEAAQERERPRGSDSAGL